MRVLLDQECAAVAGGNPFADAADLSDASRESFTSSCEEAVTNTCIGAGAYAGAVVGSATPALGTVGGAIAGGSAGQIVATVVAPPYCRYAYNNRYGSGGGGGSPAAATGRIVHQYGEVLPYGKEQLLVAPMEEV